MLEATIEEAHARANWAQHLSKEEIRELKGRRYLLKRPGNSTWNWTNELAGRTDMTPIDGLMNKELHMTQGIASLGIFAGKNGKARDDPNAKEDPLFYLSDADRDEMEAEHAEKHAEELRRRVEDNRKIRELDEAKEEIRPRPGSPDYTMTVKQLVAWAAANLDLEIKLPMNKPQIIETIEKAIGD